ncbi:hypothetical protein H261_11939 [Paramagnetospirillum caucaseum]|uniref:Uncharacterized protein n=1 Tax=Paramagnetospirillum caucaseum TaxID=1244869 RepID=M3AB61_9PROT|nr:hypothetical protein [Paramagnetospirillum caucaseum]EME69744.1 hypothetical protein H261_11939 [Paramagnetospirillum caucaseum]
MSNFSADALQICAEEGIRFDAIIPIALSCANWIDDGLPDVFTETFFEDFIQSFEAGNVNFDPLIKSLPAIAKLLKRDDFDELEAGHVADWLIEKGHLGILAMVSTPVRKYHSSGSSWSDSWAHTTYTWLYGESLQDLFVAAGEWVEDNIARWIAKAKES